MINYAIRFNVTAENERATQESDKKGMTACCFAITPLQIDANIVSRELVRVTGIPNINNIYISEYFFVFMPESFYCHKCKY